MFVKEVQSLEEYSDYKGICGCMLNRYEPTTIFYKLMGIFSNLGPQLSPIAQHMSIIYYLFYCKFLLFSVQMCIKCLE